MSTFDKDVFSATAYKRLWWNGYKGRFGALRWPTKNGFGDIISIVTDAKNYDDSELTAWHAGERLAAWLPTFRQRNGCPISLLGHSMGNIVVGNALAVLPAWEDRSVGTYIASQAAVPAQLYRPNGEDGGCRVWAPTFLGFGGWNTANVYSSGLLQELPSRFTIANFNNLNDFALSEGVSGLNQLFKPDNGSGGYLAGTNGINQVPESEFRDRFYQVLSVTGPPKGQTTHVETYLWNGTTTSQDVLNDYVQHIFVQDHVTTYPESRYYTMAYLSEARFYPLGASNDIRLSANMSRPDVALPDIWQVPQSKPMASGESRTEYDKHRWHSGQFRMTMPEQKGYWKAAMHSCGFDTSKALP